MQKSNISLKIGCVYHCESWFCGLNTIWSAVELDREKCSICQTIERIIIMLCGKIIMQTDYQKFGKDIYPRAEIYYRKPFFIFGRCMKTF